MGWQYRQIAVDPSRRMYRFTPRGGVSEEPSILLGTDSRPLSGFRHWMDPERYVLWRNAARQYLDEARSATGSLAGSQAMRRLIDAIAQCYNAANVPWYLHRDARELYWGYLSGRPNAYVFSARSENSTYGWYTPHFLTPLISDDSKGSIPKLARQLYKGHRDDVRRNDFVQTVGMGVTIPDYGTLSGRDLLRQESQTNGWYYQPDLINQGFVADTIWTRDIFGAHVDPYANVCYDRNMFALPFNKCNPDVPADGWATTGDAAQARLMLFSDANKIPAGQDDWKSFRADFGVHIGDDPMRVSLGAYFYLQWLSDWVDLLFAHDADEVVTSAREMAAYCNREWLAQASNSILSSVSDQYRQLTSRDPSITYIETGIGVTGAALASATYGISAVVAAVATLAIEIGVAINGTGDGMSINARRDDLGRYKPILERASLSGNDASSDPTHAPVFDMHDPPGTLPLGQMILVPTGGYATNRSGPSPDAVERAKIQEIKRRQRDALNQPPKEPQNKMGTGTKIVLGATALGVLAKLAGVL